MANAYQIPITYVVSASAVTPQQGLQPLKLSTIIIFTDETPANEITGSYMIARSATSVSNQWGTETETAQQAQVIFAQTPNILANDGYVIVAPFLSAEETLSEAITRLSSEIYFEGILTTRAVTVLEAQNASTLVQGMKNRIYAFPQSDVSALSGAFNNIKNNTYTKCLLYTFGEDAEEKALNSRLFAAAYLSRGLAVNYNGSNSTITMNLKDLAGIQADTNISETILAQCEAVGCDCYPSIEGLAKVISFAQGGLYFDQVTNQIWLVNTIQRDVFNALATTGTKIAQTDPALEIITKAIRKVCKQAVVNGMAAPGTWNGETFGDYEDFHRNITEFGYYIYHLPVAEQSQTDRQARKAPAYSIAVKESGAVHSANILIYIEA